MEQLVSSVHDGDAHAEREIDTLVYRLYGLTEEEIALVEAAVGRG
jgi:hypothetical protein